MGCHGYFVPRPRWEIEADRHDDEPVEKKPGEPLTAAEAARILKKRQEARMAPPRSSRVGRQQYDPVLRFHCGEKDAKY